MYNAQKICDPRFHFVLNVSLLQGDKGTGGPKGLEGIRGEPVCIKSIQFSYKLMESNLFSAFIIIFLEQTARSGILTGYCTGVGLKTVHLNPHKISYNSKQLVNPAQW